MARQAKKKTIQRKNSSTDPATDYANAVVSRQIVAGPHVRNACQRHLNDLEAGHERGLVWDIASADRAIRFFSTVLTVEIERQDEYGEHVSEAVPFDLAPSQCFIVGSLFGWKKADGLRRFRRAYIEIGKGNGKSPLAAGLGHYMLTATGKLRAECYSAATDKDQAAICFRDAVEMWRRSPNLRRRLHPSGQNPVWQLSYNERSGFFKPISSEKKGKSGIRPYFAAVDEIHEHSDNSVVEMLRAGTKGNQEALIFEITNSGSSRESVCWSEHEYTIKVCSGEAVNDSWFGYVCALDEDDDPFNDESCWPKANPLLGVSIQPDFIREQVVEAQGMQGKESLVKRLHFCQWTDGADGWISSSLWDEVEQDLHIDDYMGEVCYAGLDLSFTRDLSALALVFPDSDNFDAFMYFWKAEEGIAEASKRDRVPYDVWVKNGHLLTTPGSVIKLGPIAQKLGDIQDRFDLQNVAYDRYRHKDLEEQMSDLGVEVPMIEHPQGFRRMKVSSLWMPGSFQETENAIIETRLRVNRNPVMRWNVGVCSVRDDPAGTDNQIPDKKKSTGRIDGVAALAMAIGAANEGPVKGNTINQGFVEC